MSDVFPLLATCNIFYASTRNREHFTQFVLGVVASLIQASNRASLFIGQLRIVVFLSVRPLVSRIQYTATMEVVSAFCDALQVGKAVVFFIAVNVIDDKALRNWSVGVGPNQAMGKQPPSFYSDANVSAIVAAPHWLAGICGRDNSGFWVNAIFPLMGQLNEFNLLVSHVLTLKVQAPSNERCLGAPLDRACMWEQKTLVRLLRLDSRIIA